MIVGKVLGGLGNQMFQYTFYKYLSLTKGLPTKIDLSGFNEYSLHNGYELDNVFAIEEKIATLEEVESYKTKYPLLFKVENKLLNKNIIFGKRHFKENNFFVNKKIFCDDIVDLYIEGYFQTHKYIDYIESNYGELFKFNTPLSASEQKILHKNCVAIHIRGGDYLTNPKDRALFGNICTKEYYQKAIECVKSKVENPVFLIFTNEPVYAKQLLNDEDFEIVDWNTGKQSYRDMYLMSLCKHNIIANSSFSWWGAWLNQNDNKIVIAPSKWFNSDKISQKDICPNSWVRI